MTGEPVRLVTTPDDLSRLIEQWQDEPVVGIDTEAASFHKYRDRVYLLQLSTPTETAVVDPLGTHGIALLRDWLASERTEFIFHDADYDVRLMHREAGLRVRRLFDTRVAAQFLSLPNIGLAALLSERFGVATDKRFQRADWSARPLSPEMVVYAATDTRYLPALRSQLLDELTRAGRASWAEEECDLLTRVEWPTPDPPEEAFLRMKGARDLDRRGLAVLRELFVWRDKTAAKLDRALFRVMGNEPMLKLAASPPRSVEELGKIPGVGADNAARRGQEILDAIERGRAVPDQELPAFERRPRHRPDPVFDARVERLKAWRVGLAERYQLSPGLLAPNGLLEAVARAVPATVDDLIAVPGVRRWQAREFGAELLQVLRSGKP
ncbi:MAG: ribonuclease D [Gemmatimonadales bacterium]